MAGEASLRRLARHVALNGGVRRKKALWRPAGPAELESLILARWASRRRQVTLELLDQLTPKIQDLTRGLEQEVEKAVDDASWSRSSDGLGVRVVTGTPERFGCGKQIASYVGLVPSEDSSGDRRRLGHISKQGNSLSRFLLVEAAQVTVRIDPDWRRQLLHLALRLVANPVSGSQLSPEAVQKWIASELASRKASTGEHERQRVSADDSVRGAFNGRVVRGKSAELANVLYSSPPPVQADVPNLFNLCRLDTRHPLPYDARLARIRTQLGTSS
jgi:hypothetical protein